MCPALASLSLVGHRILNAIELSDSCSKTFLLILALYHEVAPGSSFVLGGDSVLEARWQHRCSSDVNLFVSEQNMIDFLDPLIQTVKEKKWVDRGIKVEQLFVNLGLIGRTVHGGFSIFGTRNIFEAACSNDVVKGTKVHVQRAAEILFRKIRTHMMQTASACARDAYDVVVANLFEPNELRLVLDTLTLLERKSLEFDRQRVDGFIKDQEELIQPAFPQIVEALPTFLFDVLTQRISRDDLLRKLNLSHQFPD